MMLGSLSTVMATVVDEGVGSSEILAQEQETETEASKKDTPKEDIQEELTNKDDSDDSEVISKEQAKLNNSTEIYASAKRNMQDPYIVTVPEIISFGDLEKGRYEKEYDIEVEIAQGSLGSLMISSAPTGELKGVKNKKNVLIFQNSLIETSIIGSKNITSKLIISEVNLKKAIPDNYSGQVFFDFSFIKDEKLDSTKVEVVKDADDNLGKNITATSGLKKVSVESGEKIYFIIDKITKSNPKNSSNIKNYYSDADYSSSEENNKKDMLDIENRINALYTDRTPNIKEFYTIDVVKKLKNGTKKKQEEVSSVIEIRLPYDVTEVGEGKEIFISRKHNSEVEIFKRIYNRPSKDSFKDGQFFLGSDCVYIYSSKYSLYAIGQMTALDKADYTPIHNALKNRPASLIYYTQASIDNLLSCENAVDWELENSDENNKKIKAWAKDIEDAIKNLVFKESDYSKVNEANEKYDALPKNWKALYTTLSVEKVEKAKGAIKFGLSIVNQDEINQMAKALDEAIKQLKYRPADQTKANAAMDKFSKLPIDWRTKNTEETVKGVLAAQEALSVCLAYDITRQDEVDTAASNLEKAINALKPKTNTEDDNSASDYTADVSFKKDVDFNSYSMCNTLFARKADISMNGDNATVKLYLIDPIPAPYDKDGTPIRNVKLHYNNKSYNATVDNINQVVKYFAKDDRFILESKNFAASVVSFTVPKAAIEASKNKGLSCTAYVAVGMKTDVKFYVVFDNLKKGSNANTSIKDSNESLGNSDSSIKVVDVDNLKDDVNYTANIEVKKDSTLTTDSEYKAVFSRKADIKISSGVASITLYVANPIPKFASVGVPFEKPKFVYEGKDYPIKISTDSSLKRKFEASKGYIESAGSYPCMKLEAFIPVSVLKDSTEGKLTLETVLKFADGKSETMYISISSFVEGMTSDEDATDKNEGGNKLPVTGIIDKDKPMTFFGSSTVINTMFIIIVVLALAFAGYYCYNYIYKRGEEANEDEE